MKRTAWTTAGVIAAALLLAAAELHHFLLFSSHHLDLNVDAALGVSAGRPHWRVYQNRVLGPFLLTALSGLGVGAGNAYLLLSFASLALAGYQAWNIGKHVGGPQTGWFALLMLHLAFVFLRQNPFLYVWDYLDLNVFLAFVGLVVGDATWPWFVALFSVAIVNRESGLFVPLWMTLQPAWRWLLRRPLAARQGWAMVGAGLACGIGGVWFIDYLRTTLLIEEIGPSTFRVPRGYGPHVFSNLPFNLAYVLQAKDAGLTVVLTAAKDLVVLASLAGIAAALLVVDAARYAALATTVLALTGSIVLFAQISETRVFIDTIPFLLLGACLLHARRNGLPDTAPGRSPHQAGTPAETS